eukprot:2051601-Amphidinium_carterae.3
MCLGQSTPTLQGGGSTLLSGRLVAALPPQETLDDKSAVHPLPVQEWFRKQFVQPGRCFHFVKLAVAPERPIGLDATIGNIKV